jgi:murein DD-endopeptidase MepM/ murein hydrolase activator NlpD
MMRLVPRRSRARLFVPVVLVLGLAVVGAVSYLGWRQSVGDVRVAAAPPPLVGRATPLTFALEAARGNVARAEVRVTQGGQPVVLARHDGPPSRRVELAGTMEAIGASLREGTATVEVWARDDFWRPLRRDDRLVGRYQLTVDLTPPKLEIVSTTPYVAPGGAGLVVFRGGDATRAETRVGSLTFPTFPAGPEGMRVGFFALPYDFAAGTAIAVAAQDAAGNTATRGVSTEVLPRRFRRDTIDVKDAFLQAKVPELLPQHPPSQPLIDGFLVINRDLRRQAEEEKRRVAAKTADRPLWQGPFVQPRNTKVFSNFAETRTYVYKGRQIDTQVHYGYDLASTRQAPVPAANKGIVAFAGPLTIYGNAIILDHGLGLMTLYGHLSSIGVKVGDAVERGQELGRSGSTGLAIGDHLHYEVLVHGVSVTPLEWWDAKWIRDRITGPLRAAGLADIAGGGEGHDQPAVAAAAGRPARRARHR